MEEKKKFITPAFVVKELEVGSIMYIQERTEAVLTSLWSVLSSGC